MKPSILFVCVENSCRSQMAEAFAERHGAGRIDVHSSGSRPSGAVNPRAIEFMLEVGCDLSTHSSKSLTQIPAIDFDYGYCSNKHRGARKKSEEIKPPPGRKSGEKSHSVIRPRPKALFQV